MSERVRVLFAGPNADRLFERTDKDLAVADLTGARGRHDRLDDAVDEIRRDRHFDFQLWQEAHRVFSPAVDFRVPLLTPVAFDFGHREPVHADGGERVAHLVKLERLDY